MINLVIDAIDEFVTRYDRNRFITSCRTAVHKSDFRHFFNVELADFDENQIKSFIRNWFKLPKDIKNKTAKRCWEELSEQRNQSAKELAQTPLLLTFLCLVYDRTQKFPEQRAALYRKALDVLLEEWAAEKRLPVGDVHNGLNTELEKVMLAEIAYKGFIENQLFFTSQELIACINKFVEETVDKPSMPGKAILNAIAEQQGILVERAEGVYSFSHLTLQEYLTAQYISQDPELTKEIVQKYLEEDFWREVLLLVPGLLRNADSYLQNMQQTTQRYLENLQVKALIRWADQATQGSDSHSKPAAKRAAAIALVRAIECNPKSNDSTFDYAYALAHTLRCDRKLGLLRTRIYHILRAFDLTYNPDPTAAFDSVLAFDIALARRYSEAGIFSNADISFIFTSIHSLRSRLSDKENGQIRCREEVLQKYRSVWWEGLNIDEYALIFESTQIKTLSNYLKLNLMLIEAKKSAVRVSKDAWNEIENKMLTVWDADEDS